MADNPNLTSFTLDDFNRLNKPKKKDPTPRITSEDDDKKAADISDRMTSHRTVNGVSEMADYERADEGGFSRVIQTSGHEKASEGGENAVDGEAALKEMMARIKQ